MISLPAINCSCNRVAIRTYKHYIAGKFQGGRGYKLLACFRSWVLMYHTLTVRCTNVGDACNDVYSPSPIVSYPCCKLVGNLRVRGLVRV